MRIEEDLMGEIRRRAAEEHVSINRMINLVLRAGLSVSGEVEKPRFRQRVHSMGVERVDISRASELLAALDDAEFAGSSNNE